MDLFNRLFHCSRVDDVHVGGSYRFLFGSTVGDRSS